MGNVPIAENENGREPRNEEKDGNEMVADVVPQEPTWSAYRRRTVHEDVE